MQKVWGLLFVFLFGISAHAESCRLDPSTSDRSRQLYDELVEYPDIKPKNSMDFPMGDTFREHSTRYLLERYNLFLRETYPSLDYIQRQEIVEEFEQIINRFNRNAPSLAQRVENKATWKLPNDPAWPNVALKIFEKINRCIESPHPKKSQVYLEDFLISLANLLRDKLLEAYRASVAKEFDKLNDLSQEIMEITAFVYMTISKAKPDGAVQNKHSMHTLYGITAALAFGTLAIPDVAQNSYILGTSAFMGMLFLNETLHKIPRLNEKIPSWVTRIWAYQLLPNFMLFNWFQDDYDQNMAMFWRTVRALIANTPEFAENVDGLIKVPALPNPVADGPDWLTRTLRDLTYNAAFGKDQCQELLAD